MKTLEAIQYEVGSNLSDDVIKKAKIAYLMRIMAMTGDIANHITAKEKLKVIGDFSLLLCEYACVEGVTIPHGPSSPVGKDVEMDESYAERPLEGIVVHVGHLGGIQADAVIEGVSDHKEYELDVVLALWMTLHYMDHYCRELSKSSSLLKEANRSYIRWKNGIENERDATSKDQSSLCFLGLA